MIEYANTPPALWAWTVTRAGNIWQEIREELSKFPGNTNRFVIAIVFCPDGPTSGTVGVELGSQLRQNIAAARRNVDIPPGWDIQVVGVYTPPDRPRGRGRSPEMPPVKARAEPFPWFPKYRGDGRHWPGPDNGFSYFLKDS